MKTKPYIYSIILLALNCLNAQISGIINTYTKVINITTPCPKITVSDASGFAIDDKVLIIQMKGATVVTANNTTFGNIAAYNNAGNYEFAEIKDIQGWVIHLKYELIKDYDPVDLVQLVRIPQYTDITVTGTLTAQAWNGNTGGVLVFEASGTVTLNADIDVSGLGFKGGKVNDSEPNEACSSNFISIDSTSIFAARKGESISQYIEGSENGYGKQANGGGGGMANNTGGGGGSNFAGGNRGGNQAKLLGGGTFSGCNVFGSGNPGIGGLGLTYSNAQNKLFLGGGGGAGHQNNTHNGGHSTNGGNGGGIILIKASNLVGNNNTIKNNGTISLGPSSPAVGDAAGGGGGAGTIAIDCNIFSSLNVEVIGGNGDNVSDLTNRDMGPGGGGGGGLLWISTATASTNISLNANGGMAGISAVGNTNFGALKGNDGGILTELKIPESTVTGTGCTTPLQLLAFTATLQSNRVLVQWTTAQETAIAYYQVQRSIDGAHFETIANISLQEDAGIHHYSFNDFQVPDNENIYYRLAEVSQSNRAKHLSTVSVRKQIADKWLQTSPNPFNDQLKIKALQTLQQIELIDVNGKTCLSLAPMEEGSSFEINTSTLLPGFYVLKIVHEGSHRYEKLLKR